MPLDPIPANPDAFLLAACGFYDALTSMAAAPTSEIESNLGGNLLYARELDANGRALMIAGNVAGCATLAVAEDAEAQKQAIRDGVVDFLVSTLDEGLRILKNEIRKRAAVAVCVGALRLSVEREMLERGVLPDLVAVAEDERTRPDFGPGSREIAMPPYDRSRGYVAWHAMRAPARWMGKLDEIALTSLEADAWARRWIRLSPRYCGRSLQAHRGLCCSREAAMQIAGRLAAAVESGGVDAEVVVRTKIDAVMQELRLSPAAPG